MKQLAASEIPVTVSLETLGLSPSPYYRWLEQPITAAELNEAYLANAIFDDHRDDPEFGYRFLTDEIRAVGLTAAVYLCTIKDVCRTGSWGTRSATGWPRRSLSML